MNGTETPAPFRDVIVGVDGRQGGRDAVALARLLLAPTGRLTLAHVRAGGLFPPTVEDVALETELDAPEYVDSRGLLERERATTHVEARLTDTVASSVGRGIHELAEREGADLLVVGSRNRGFLGRVLVGDDTRASLNGASCAVAVAPLAYDHAPARLATIGVGYDGSPESKDALGLARALAAVHGATVRALQVVLLPTWRFGGVVGGAWADAVEAEVAACRQEMSELEGVQGDAVFGVTGEELAALGRHVDLLVVGSRAYGPVHRLMLGSTSNYLVRHARCPLLVLPRGAAARSSTAD